MKWIKRLVPVLGTLALLVFLLWQVHPMQIIGQVARANVAWLLAGLACYVATNVVRSYRTAALLDVAGFWPPLAMLPDMFLLSLFNNTLPSRSGELSFPYLMLQRHRIPIGESATILIVMRILDYCAVAFMFLIAAGLAAGRLAPAALRVVGATVAFLLVTSLSLASLPWLGNRALGWLQRQLERRGLAASRLGAWLLKSGVQGVAALARMRDPRLTAFAGMTSCLGWLGTFAWFACFMQAVGSPQPLLLVIVGATFATLAKAIPLISIGGLGAHEAGWTLGFGLVGVPAATAIVSGFSVNILTLLSSALCGGTALLYVALARRNVRSTPTGTAASTRT
jgi:uncharacterized protein (TIRG00374 family)